MNKKILIADDEILIRDFIGSFFETSDTYQKCQVDFAVNGEEAIEFIKKKDYDLIFTDLKMPHKSGIEVIKFVHHYSPDTDIILLTAFAGAESASQAMAYGAYEYLSKPITVEELEIIIKRVFERRDLINQNKSLKEQLYSKMNYNKIVGDSKPMEEIMDIIKMVAPTNSTVLVTGESGTGKELVAEAIHYLSNRKDNNFIKINCAALPESLIESELFGFEKGAFTGAIKQTRGKFELADNGTILLDEISEMNLELQAKLLRVIQEREIVRIGSEVPRKINTRIIATSNRDLIEEVKAGRFREDLFFRLNIVPIHLPPLRERKSDIPKLISTFLKKASFELGVPTKSITPEAVQILLHYDWPGNIRELQNAIERATITTRNSVLSESSFSFIKNNYKKEKIDSSEEIEKAMKMISQDNKLHETNASNNITEEVELKTIAEVEKELIFKALEKTDNNKTEAAKILGVTARTLRNKLKLYSTEEIDKS